MTRTALGQTASMFPSSRYLANALTKPIDFRRARTVVELGPGTGAVTNEILKRMRPDAKLFAVDINETFIDHLRSTCQDPRLVPAGAMSQREIDYWTEAIDREPPTELVKPTAAE